LKNSLTKNNIGVSYGFMIDKRVISRAFHG